MRLNRWRPRQRSKTFHSHFISSMALSPCPPVLADKLKKTWKHYTSMLGTDRQTEGSRTWITVFVCAIETRHLSSQPLVALTLCVCLCVLCLSVSQVITLASWWMRRWQSFPSTSWRTQCTGAALPTTLAWHSCRCLFVSVSLCELQHFHLVSRRVSAAPSNHSNQLLFSRSITNHSLGSC